ncbi:MAG: hypothetical protein WA057_00420 [Candidatus Magasanikiibacteriota bacterium]
MFENKIIIYKYNGGPITIEIKAKYATLGSYSIAYLLGDVTTKLGDGKLSDAIPDIYILPVSIGDLTNCRVYIAGTYVSAPGHNEIDVEYHFSQDGNETAGDNPIIIEKNQSALSATHSIKFKTA